MGACTSTPSSTSSRKAKSTKEEHVAAAAAPQQQQQQQVDMPEVGGGGEAAQEQQQPQQTVVVAAPSDPSTSATSKPPTTTSKLSLTELLFPARVPPNQELAQAVEEIKRGSRTDLDLRYANVGDSHVKTVLLPLLEECPNLVSKIVLKQFETNKAEDKVSLVGITLLAQALRNPRITLRELDLSGCQLGDQGCLQLTEVLLHKPTGNTMGILCLLANDITDVGATAIADVLMEKPQIWNLSLHNNNITSVGAKKLVNALAVNRTVTTLHLLGNQIDYEGVNAFAQYLRHDTGASLVELNLGHNAFADRDVDVGRALGVALIHNTSLRILDLSINEMSAVALGFLSDGLKHNSTLQTLGLVKCGIDCQGVEYLADALLTNSTLQVLTLSDNHIADEGAMKLAEALEVNVALDTLTLPRNTAITTVGRRALVKAFVVSSAPLNKFVLDDMSFSGIGLNSLVPSHQPQAWPARVQQLPTGWIYFDSLRNWIRANERGDRVFFTIPAQFVRRGAAFTDAFYDTAREVLPLMSRIKGFPEDLCKEIFLILMEDRLSIRSGNMLGNGGGPPNLTALVEAWEGEQ